jgi:hypothetical protein
LHNSNGARLRKGTQEEEKSEDDDEEEDDNGYNQDHNNIRRVANKH